ncbi:hypothetical protein FH972_015929 [Carpinus fangiana]|uniref:FAF domain-containing protein n=1 Tax=Carpinus fangiana TaxID=176857 RepID=A0A5N6RH10_9ROSI|nr:hypothetical protein FH972_015929 [Carpinus fangiana]
MGDYIGMESGLDLEDNGGAHASRAETESSGAYSKCRGKRDQRLAMMKRREFPPPIPLLARTENLSCRMPWVLKRHYTSDGRLILTEERVRRHEYFRAHRANGRLTLQLVPLDDDVSPSTPVADEDDSDSDDYDENQEAHDYNIENVDVGAVLDKDRISFVEDSTPAANGSGGIGGNGAGKCLNYNNMASGSSCIFGVPLPAIRTVHS